MVGLERGTAELEPYRSEWKRCYEREADRLRSIAGDRLCRVEHVGSTAVEGLAAKPINDLLAVVEGMETATGLVPLLEDHGYEFRHHARGRVFLAKGPRTNRTHYLSLAERDGEFAAEQIAFRDCLRTHPDVAAEYEALKRRLAAEHPDDRDAYTERKDEFIQQVLERAMDDR